MAQNTQTTYLAAHELGINDYQKGHPLRGMALLAFPALLHFSYH
jgi:hypothetical protein